MDRTHLEPILGTCRRGCLDSQPEGTRCKSLGENLTSFSNEITVFADDERMVDAIYFTCRNAFTTVPTTSLITYWSVGVYMRHLGWLCEWARQNLMKFNNDTGQPVSLSQAEPLPVAHAGDGSVSEKFCGDGLETMGSTKVIRGQLCTEAVTKGQQCIFCMKSGTRLRLVIIFSTLLRLHLNAATNLGSPSTRQMSRNWNKFGRRQPEWSVAGAFSLPAQVVELMLVHLGGGTDQKEIFQLLHRGKQGAG